MVRVDASGLVRSLQKLEGDIPKIATRVLRDAAAHAHAHAKATGAFNDRTGTLRASITRGERGPLATFVQAGAHYAAYLEFGTRARGNHPGIRPRRFMRDARESAMRFVEAGASSSFR
jgi:HK97 gp10 family phage protein